jgi:hypothetical protein
VVLHLPLRQFRSTTSLSQYTVFHGRVNLTSLVRAPPSGAVFGSSPSESLVSTFAFLEGIAGELGADLLTPEAPKGRPIDAGTIGSQLVAPTLPLVPKASARVTTSVG